MATQCNNHTTIIMQIAALVNGMHKLEEDMRQARKEFDMETLKLTEDLVCILVKLFTHIANFYLWSVQCVFTLN